MCLPSEQQMSFFDLFVVQGLLRPIVVIHYQKFEIPLPSPVGCSATRVYDDRNTAHCEDCPSWVYKNTSHPPTCTWLGHFGYHKTSIECTLKHLCTLTKKIFVFAVWCAAPFPQPPCEYDVCLSVFVCACIIYIYVFTIYIIYQIY